MTVRDKFLSLEDALNDVLVERHSEVHSAILALVAEDGRHLFMVGPPGIAKSMLVNQLVARIGDLDRSNYFKWLLTKHTTPEELFGPPDFTLMRNEGIYKRRTDKKLPQAHIAFLDEAFKANSAILNTLLTAINEGEFENHDDDPAIPLRTLFAASNEIPTSSELEALADRLHFWHYVKPIREPSNFVKMLSMDEVEADPIITMEDIEAASSEVVNVEIPDLIYEVLLELRTRMEEEGITVSDRRFRSAIPVIQAEAWMNGREVATVNDCKPLQHMMWRDLSQIATARKAVLDLVDPLERDTLSVLADVEEMYSEFLRDIEEATSHTRKAQVAIVAYQKWRSAFEECEALEDRAKAEGATDQKTIKRLRVKLKELGPTLLKQGEVLDVDSPQLGSGNDDKF